MIADTELSEDVQAYLVAALAGVSRNGDLLRGLLDTDDDGVAQVIQSAQACGLLEVGGLPLPSVVEALPTLVPVQRRIAVHRRLIQLRRAEGGSMLDVVRPLLDTGVGGAEFADAFEAAAEEVLGTTPALAARLYAAAVAAGADELELSARWARASALAGDLDTALRRADRVIGMPDAPRRTEAAQVAAVVLGCHGQSDRSAELLRWAGDSTSTAFAAIAMLGVGRRAEQPAPAADDGPPTLLTGAARLAAQGIACSVDRAASTALADLTRASSMVEHLADGALLPDSPAALGAILAVHAGELAVAESLLDRALAAEVGSKLLLTRHRLLRAWVSMIRGDLDAATAVLAEVLAGAALQPRDWLFAVGLEVGLARRGSDVKALRSIWAQAREAVIRHPVDLFTLLPFGEFVVAAARLDDRDRLAPHLHQAHALLDALGDPPLWAAALRWSCLHAAIISERSDEAREHAAALSAYAEREPLLATANRAAQQWVRVLAGGADADEVIAVARDLHAAGLRWDAARLAGQAAIRTTDRTAMVALLDCARALHGGKPGPAASAPAAAPPQLSEREIEVAELVVSGMTYKQIGDRLYISAKTVEHHVARMRQRLGATSRRELLDQLRTLVQT